jgi:hypothetical protein
MVDASMKPPNTQEHAMSNAMTKNERAGYDAAALCEPRDPQQSAEWLAGWDRYEADMARSETQRYV